MSISQGLVMEENEDPGFQILHLSKLHLILVSMVPGLNGLIFKSTWDMDDYFLFSSLLAS